MIEVLVEAGGFFALVLCTVAAAVVWGALVDLVESWQRRKP